MTNWKHTLEMKKIIGKLRSLLGRQICSGWPKILNHRDSYADSILLDALNL